MNILEHFKYEHLPAELQEISRPFGELAKLIASRAHNAQQRMSLEHLLIAKDAAVRAKRENDFDDAAASSLLGGRS